LAGSRGGIDRNDSVERKIDFTYYCRVPKLVAVKASLKRRMAVASVLQKNLIDHGGDAGKPGTNTAER
jgi:hypothetical protein